MAFHREWEGVDLEPQGLVVGPGSKELIFLTLAVFRCDLSPGPPLSAQGHGVAVCPGLDHLQPTGQAGWPPGQGAASAPKPGMEAKPQHP